MCIVWSYFWKCTVWLFLASLNVNMCWYHFLYVPSPFPVLWTTYDFSTCQARHASHERSLGSCCCWAGATEAVALCPVSLFRARNIKVGCEEFDGSEEKEKEEVRCCQTVSCCKDLRFGCPLHLDKNADVWPQGVWPQDVTLPAVTGMDLSWRHEAWRLALVILEEILLLDRPVCVWHGIVSVLQKSFVERWCCTLIGLHVEQAKMSIPKVSFPKVTWWWVSRALPELLPTGYEEARSNEAPLGHRKTHHSKSRMWTLQARYHLWRFELRSLRSRDMDDN